MGRYNWDWIKLHPWSLLSRLLLMLAFGPLLELLLILWSYQLNHQGAQSLWPSLKCCDLLLKLIRSLFFACTSAVSASWLWMRTSDHFWLRPNDLLLKRHSVRLRLETMDAKWCMLCLCKNKHEFFYLSKKLSK